MLYRTYWHALTSCDTTGNIYGKGKKGCFATFLDLEPAVLSAIAEHGEGDEPSEEVIQGCQIFLCKLFSSKALTFENAK